MPNKLKRCTLFSSIMITSFAIGLLFMIPVTAQTTSYSTRITVDVNERYSYQVTLNENETMVCWLEFLSGDGIYAYILNSTEHEDSQWLSPTSTHAETVFVNTSESIHHWNFTAPYEDEWHLYFSKWTGDPYAGSPCEIEILIGVWMLPSIFNVVLAEGSFAGTFDISLSLISKNTPIDRIEFYVDDILDATFPLATESAYMYAGTFSFDSLKWSNGNHTLQIVAYDSLGNPIASWESLIRINNDFFSHPGNLLIVLLLFVIIIFILSMVTFQEWARPATENEKWLKSMIWLSLFGILSLGIGMIEFSPLNSDISRGLSYLFGLSFLSIGGLFSTYYTSTRLKIRKSASSIIEKPEEGGEFELSVDQLLGRSDILDKVRGNIRTGTAVVMGIGSGIFWWLLNQQRQLSMVEFLFLVASGGLALFSATGLLLSFSHISTDEGHNSLREDLLPRTQFETVYKKQLEEIVILKVETLSKVRQAIGIGLLWFVVVAILGLVFPIFLMTTLASPIFAITVSTLIPLGILTVTIGRFTQIAIGPFGLRLSKAKSIESSTSQSSEEPNS